MRRSLNLLVLASTALVVVAFVIPLALTVKRQADQRARVEAEREVQEVAALVVQAVSSGDTVTATSLQGRTGPLADTVAVVLPGGEALGSFEPLTPLVSSAVDARRGQSTYTDRGWELAVPILTRTEPIVVYGLVPNKKLIAGVTEAWATLGLLGLGLIGASLVLADRLGRTLVGPSRRIADAAHALGAGDLDTRVEIEGPPEMKEVAEAFNTLASRLRDLLREEREAVADLSHRLRTPLTALRLEIEQLPDETTRKRLLMQTDRLHQAIDELIREARRVPEGRSGRCDLVQLVRERVAYWALLADEQGRDVNTRFPDGPVVVELDHREMGAAVEALLENVFSHTPAGTPFEVSVELEDGYVSLIIEDAGPGFPRDTDVLGRGASGADSTGLGLDIARRVAQRTDGELHLSAGPDGGAQVKLRMRVAG